MRLFFYFILLLGFYSCDNWNESNIVSLETDEIINSKFSVEQVNKLRELLDFFDKEVCRIVGANEMEKCYSKYFQDLEKSPETGNIDIRIDYNVQRPIMDNMGENLFNEIWAKSKSTVEYYKSPQSKMIIGIPKKESDYTKQDSVRQIYLIKDGLYAEFLGEVGDNNSLIKKYHNHLLEMNSISPIMVADFLMNYDKFNLKDDKVRLIIAIHYLTLNDNDNREN